MKRSEEEWDVVAHGTHGQRISSWSIAQLRNSCHLQSSSSLGISFLLDILPIIIIALIVITYQTAQGINFLHQCNPAIIHCDIKSHNVLLDNKWNARISDFGITKLAKFQQDSNGKHEALGTVSNNNNSLLTLLIDITKIYWAAPEILNNRPHTPKSDCKYSITLLLEHLF